MVQTADAGAGTQRDAADLVPVDRPERTRHVPGLRDHLDAPQFTDEHGESTGETMFRFGGSWVRSGVPRWKGYLLYVISLVGGFALVLPLGGSGFDLISFAGLAFMAVGVVGIIETWRGRPFSNPFQRPPEP
jgi:hypothetical protein